MIKEYKSVSHFHVTYNIYGRKSFFLFFFRCSAFFILNIPFDRNLFSTLLEYEMRSIKESVQTVCFFGFFRQNCFSYLLMTVRKDRKFDLPDYMHENRATTFHDLWMRRVKKSSPAVHMNTSI